MKRVASREMQASADAGVPEAGSGKRMPGLESQRPIKATFRPEVLAFLQPPLCKPHELVESSYVWT